MVHGKPSMRSCNRRIGPRKKRKRHVINTAEHIQEQSIQDAYCDSDEYFKTCFEELSTDCHTPSSQQENEESYLILDKVYKYDTETELKNLMQTKLTEIYYNMKDKCKTDLFEFENFGLLPTSKYIQYVQLYEEKEEPVIKICVTVQLNFTVRICVNAKPLPNCHTVWSALPDPCNTIMKVRTVLNLISLFKVCPGNPDSTYWTLHDKYMHPDKSVTAGYFDNIGFQTTGASNCALLIKNPRCNNCCFHRKTLNKSLSLNKSKVDTPKKNWVKSTNGNTRMSNSQKFEKIHQLRNYASSLESEVKRLKKNGETVF